MRSVTSLLIVMVFMSAGLYGMSFAGDTGSATKEEVKKESVEAYKKAKSYADMKKDEYAKKMKESLADLSKKIENLKAKAKDAKGEAAIKMNAALAELKAKQEAANKKLKELGKGTSSAWSALKSRLDKAMGDLKNAYDNAAQKIK